MPFRSLAQKGWMFANHPQMAKRWAADTPSGAKLPEHVQQDDNHERRKKRFPGILSTLGK